MSFKILKIFIIILYLISPTKTYSIDQPILKNLIFHKQPKNISDFEFKNIENKTLKISDFKDKLVIVNFWATWCAPCKEEMPSLDKILDSNNFKNLEIIPINIGKENISKSVSFFKETNIRNLKIYYDNNFNIPKKLLLRGIPTTLIINKDGKEFARILGAIDFQDDKFLKWLENYN